MLAREDAPGDKRLVAYCHAGEGAAASAEALRAHSAAQRCRTTWCRRRIVRLEALPLTPNGKLDRKALPAPDDEAYVTRGYEAPQGEIEERAGARSGRSCWASSGSGRHDNFFELGGHSLLAVQLVSRLRAGAGRGAGARATLFAQPVLARLGRRRGRRRAAQPAAGRSRRSTAAGRCRCRFAQQRLWFLDQLDRRGSAAYHIPARLRLSGRSSTGRRWRAALDRLVARHEALRTRFVQRGRRAGAADRARGRRLCAARSTTCAAMPMREARARARCARRRRARRSTWRAAR